MHAPLHLSGTMHSENSAKEASKSCGRDCQAYRLGDTASADILTPTRQHKVRRGTNRSGETAADNEPQRFITETPSTCKSTSILN